MNTILDKTIECLKFKSDIKKTGLSKHFKSPLNIMLFQSNNNRLSNSANQAIFMADQALNGSISENAIKFWMTDKQSCFQSLAQISLSHDQQCFDQQFDMLSSQKKQFKNKPSRKKRKSKFKRQSENSEDRDKRDIKKYAKLDAINLMFEKFTLKKGTCFQVFQNLLKKQNISKRSLRCFFICLGILKKQGLLQNYHNFFSQNIGLIMNQKYQHRSQRFKKLLLKSLNYSQKAIDLFLKNEDLKGIQIAYSENTSGLKGKTKNPKEMQNCQNIYLKLFPPGSINNTNDLDLYFG